MGFWILFFSRLMSDSSDKTEQPTPKRLRDARKKGQVAKSKEVSSAAVIVSLMLLLLLASDFYLGKFEELFETPVWLESVSFEAAFDVMVEEVLKLGLAMLFPVMLIGLLAAVLSNFAQVGVLFAPETIKPDLKKINPAKALKNIFSKKNMVELLKSLLKISFMTYLIGHIIWVNASTIMGIPYCGMNCIMPILGMLFSQVVIYASIAFIVVAAADFVFQKFEHIKGLKMSKDEVKREYKETEGSPEIKGRRRQLFMEIINTQQTSNVKRSSVIVTNPTHLAIGLYYDQERTPLPVVTLKEQGCIAQRIVEIAEQEGIPVMQNVPLAHSLMLDAGLHTYIPDDLIAPVAEVLLAVRGLQA